jgi:tetratricopeptide (TPR) repeat protein
LLLQRKFPDAYQQLARGLSIAPADPWLRVTLAKYYDEIDQPDKAAAELNRVISGGPGPDSEQRRAYTVAMVRKARILGELENASEVRAWAMMADVSRHPKDAWTLGSFAETFLAIGLFDDSITYASKALKVMDYGVARRTLAFALYGRAAELVSKGANGSEVSLREADELNYSRQAAIDWFERGEPKVVALVPFLKKLFALHAPRVNKGPRASEHGTITGRAT